MKKNNKIITIILFLLLSITILSNFSPNKEIKTIETLPRKPQGAVLDIEVTKVKTEEFKDVFIDRENKVIFVDFSNLQNKAKLRSDFADNSQYEVVLTDAIFSTGDTRLNGKKSAKAPLPKILPYEIIQGEEGKAFKIKYETKPEFLYMTIKNKNTNSIEKIYKSNLTDAPTSYSYNHEGNSPHFLQGPTNGEVKFILNKITGKNLNRVYNIYNKGSDIPAFRDTTIDYIEITGTLPKKQNEKNTQGTFAPDQTTKQNFVRIIKKNSDFYTRDYIFNSGNFDTKDLPFLDLKGQSYSLRFFVADNSDFVSFELKGYNIDNGIDEEITVEYWNSCYSFWEVKRIPHERMYNAKFKIKIPPKQQPYPDYFVGFSFLNPIPKAFFENNETPKGFYQIQDSPIGKLNPNGKDPIHNETGNIFSKSGVTDNWNGYPKLNTSHKIGFYIDGVYRGDTVDKENVGMSFEIGGNTIYIKFGYINSKFGLGLSEWKTYDTDASAVLEVRERAGNDSATSPVVSNTTYKIIIPKLNPEIYYETSGTIEKGELIEREVESNIREISLGMVKIKNADLSLFNNTFKFHETNEILEFISSDKHVVKGKINLRPKIGSSILENEVIFKLEENEFFQSGKIYLLKGNSEVIGAPKNIINLGIASIPTKAAVFYNLSSRIKIVCENPSFILKYSSNDLDFGKVIEKQFNANEAKATIEMEYKSGYQNKKYSYKIKKPNEDLDTVYTDFKLYLEGFNPYVLSDISLGVERIPNLNTPEKRVIDIVGKLKEDPNFSKISPGIYKNTINIVVTLEEAQ